MVGIEGNGVGEKGKGSVKNEIAIVGTFKTKFIEGRLPRGDGDALGVWMGFWVSSGESGDVSVGFDDFSDFCDFLRFLYVSWLNCALWVVSGVSKAKLTLFSTLDRHKECELTIFAIKINAEGDKARFKRVKSMVVSIVGCNDHVAVSRMSIAADNSAGI